MVSLKHSLLIITALTALFLSSAFAINCYQCESTSNENCGEEFSSDGVKTNCSNTLIHRILKNTIPLQEATGCKKTIVEVGVSKTKHILRSCYYGDTISSSGCETDSSIPYVKQISCDVCIDNLCNGSSSVTGSIVFTIGLLALVAYCLF